MSEEAINRDPHDPNKGLNVRTFSWAVLIALLVILVGSIFVVRKERAKLLPHSVVPRANNVASPQ